MLYLNDSSSYSTNNLLRALNNSNVFWVCDAVHVLPLLVTENIANVSLGVPIIFLMTEAYVDNDDEIWKNDIFGFINEYSAWIYQEIRFCWLRKGQKNSSRGFMQF